jgi:hypothetical protein
MRAKELVKALRGTEPAKSTEALEEIMRIHRERRGKKA